jgi:hypothetical protein
MSYNDEDNGERHLNIPKNTEFTRIKMLIGIDKVNRNWVLTALFFRQVGQAYRAHSGLFSPVNWDPWSP